ncbi:MAG: leucine-rich repeat domain-containing protein, partial [Eubacteriales bacterium]|nr:leucine-rich repeat domain-containing protein [Eubacteriales bacterium]
MRKISKRGVALFLALTMTISALQTCVFATESKSTEVEATQVKDSEIVETEENERENEDAGERHSTGTFSIVRIEETFTEMIQQASPASNENGTENTADEETEGSITYTLENGVLTIRGTGAITDGAFQNNTDITEVIIEDGVTEISSNAFRGCTNLVKIMVPDSIISIDNYAFEGCKALTGVVLPKNLENLGVLAFGGCTALTEIQIPASLTTVDSSKSYSSEVGAFKGSGLQKATIEDGMQTIPSYLFFGSEKLTTVTIPDSVTVIDNYAFDRCTALTGVVLPKNLEKFGILAFGECTALTEIQIPASLTTVDSSKSYSSEAGAFKGSGLQKATIEDGMQTIPSYLFFGSEKLTTVTIPDSVTVIGNYVFNGCIGLRNLQIPSSVTTVEKDTFTNCDNLTIYCDNPSEILIYAIENNISVQIANMFTDDDSYVLNRDGTNIYANMDSMSVNGTVPITVQYSIKDAWIQKISDMSIKLFLPNGVEFDESTLMVDGELCTDYQYDDERTVTIPVSKAEGIIKYSVKTSGSEKFNGYTALQLKKNGVSAYELIGILNEIVEPLTIEVPDITGTETINVSGAAPASTAVSVAVDGDQQITVMSNKNGRWSTEVTLIQPQDYTSHEIDVSCFYNEKEISKVADITYCSDQATMTDFTMTYNEHNVIKTCDLMNRDYVRPKVYYLPG